jgi:hypothetical protein
MLSISRYTALLPLLEDDNCNLFPPNIRQILIEVHATPTDMELAPTPFDGMVWERETTNPFSLLCFS